MLSPGPNAEQGVINQMSNLTAAEVLCLQEHARTAIAGARFLNHCANETADSQFKQLCQQFAQEKQQEISRVLPLINGTATPNVTQ